jgi:thioredoxin reductase (NADPH)
MASELAPVAIVGAGPTGIACAVELQRRGVAAACYDRGGILDTIYRFPEEMRWFSTRDLLDIAGVPFGSPDAHPTRLETLAYYRGVAERFGVRVVSETRIDRITPRPGGGLAVEGEARGRAAAFDAPAGILATGFFGNPRRLGVPGEDLPHVHERYVSGYPFHGRDVVVGGREELRLRGGARPVPATAPGSRSSCGATRSPDRVKYWIKPDLENRIKAGAIRALFSTNVVAITRDACAVSGPDGEREVPADACSR